MWRTRGLTILRFRLYNWLNLVRGGYACDSTPLPHSVTAFALAAQG